MSPTELRRALESIVVRNSRLKLTGVEDGHWLAVDLGFDSHTEKILLDRLREGAGVIEVGLALQPASLKLAAGSNEKITVKYLTRKRE